MARILLKNGKIFDGERFSYGSVLIEDGKIAAIGQIDPEIDDKCVVIDAADCTVCPGLVDVHMAAVGAEKKSLVVLPEVNKMVVKSFDNIPGVLTSLYNTINVYDILNADKFIITEAAVKMLQEVYA